MFSLFVVPSFLFSSYFGAVTIEKDAAESLPSQRLMCTVDLVQYAIDRVHPIRSSAIAHVQIVFKSKA